MGSEARATRPSSRDDIDPVRIPPEYLAKHRRLLLFPPLFPPLDRELLDRTFRACLADRLRRSTDRQLLRRRLLAEAEGAADQCPVPPHR